MNVVAHVFRDHATAISRQQLRRSGRPLRSLPPADRAAVEELADSVAQALVDLLVEEGEHNAALGVALASIYGGTAGPL